MEKEAIIEWCAKRLRELRNERDYTQQDLAGLSGISRLTIRNAEAGKNDTGISVLVRLVAVMDFTMVDFFATFPKGD